MRLNNRSTLPLFIFVSLLVAMFVYWLGYDKPSFGIDDANIYFVYMKNLATGHGFVWNIGGEKVEGFTSLLWTLIGAFFYRLSGEKYTWWLLGLNFILTYQSIWRLLLLLRRCNNTTNENITASDVLIMALLIFPLGFLEWNILSLMETGLWFFLIANLTISLCNFYLTGKKQNIFIFSILISVMILTRPESIAFCLLFISILFIQQLTTGGLKTALVRTCLPLAAYIVTLAGLIIWRKYYFGYPFPNTYYAKVSSSEKDNIVRGLSYLQTLFYTYPQASLTAALGMAFAIILLNKWKKEKKLFLSVNDKVILTQLAILLAGLTLPVLTGGDHFKLSRFYQCILPVSYAIALNTTFWNEHIANLRIPDRKSRAWLSAALIFAIFFVAKSTWYDFMAVDKLSSGRILPEFYHAREGRIIADSMNLTFSDCKQYPSVGVLAAGGYTYDYKGNTIDMMGLNNTMMAHANRVKKGFRNHASFDINTFWKLQPDILGPFYGGEVVTDTASFILPENTYYFRHGEFVYGVFKQIYDYPRFIQNYFPALIRRNGDNFYIFAYYHKPFINSLDSQHFQVILLERKLTPATLPEKIES